MTDLAERIARLVHDVGKHGTRAARNLPDGPVPAVLVGMLIADLYGAGGEPSATARFETLAPPEGVHAALDRVRALLAEIGGLEAEVRRADDGALRRAAALALEIDAVLRDAAREGAR